MKAGACRGFVLLAAGLASVPSGCGVVYVNPSDRNPSYATRTSFVASKRAEPTYRIIYARLLDCTSGYYRVHGEFDNVTKRGEISVDTGVGFQRTLFLADAHVMRIEIVPGAGATSEVTVHQKTDYGAPLVRAMEPWVNRGSEQCRQE